MAEQDHRRIPPHDDVSPDGERIWPRPSTAARLLVWGGTAVAAVAVTAGTALLLGRVSDALTRSDRSRPQPREATPQPRPRPDATPNARRCQQDETAAVRPSGHQTAAPERRPSERDWIQGTKIKGTKRESHATGPFHQAGPVHDKAPRRPDRAEGRSGDAPRRPRRRKARNLIDEFEDNSRRMTNSVDGVVGSLGAAMTGFLSVARQAGTIMREFGDAADLVRNVMGSAGKPAPGAGATSAQDGEHRPDRRTHKL